MNCCKCISEFREDKEETDLKHNVPFHSKGAVKQIYFSGLFVCMCGIALRFP